MERELQEIRKLLQRMENMFERTMPYIDELERELKLVREYLEKHDRREERRDTAASQESRNF